MQEITPLASQEAQDLEEQIQMQNLTVEYAKDYFESPSLAVVHCNDFWASASQIEKLSHKNRMAVKGVNPWSNESTAVFPKPEKCTFCGKALEYIAIVRHNKKGIFEWEVLRWAKNPLRCDCEQAVKAHEKELEEKFLKEKEEQELRTMEMHQERINRQLLDSGMKKRFQTRTFENFITDTNGRKRAFKAAKEYADNFDAHKENGEGLYIEGTFGTGKTHLAAAIAMQVMAQGHGAIFKTADDLLHDIKMTFDESGQAQEKVIDRFKRCGLLIIDDIGKEQATDWSTAQLYTIINDRYECMRPTIITTNFNEDDLIRIESPAGVGAHRIRAILSRLHETCSLITMDWRDWRG